MAKFLTKKVCLIILATVVAAGGIIWAVVANITPKFRSVINAIPAANYVSGNGTASVMVDNYLYFVGDSVATSSIQYGDNEYYAHGKMPDTGIFRVKINEDNRPVLNYTYDNTYTNEETGDSAEWQIGDDKYNTVVTKINDWDHVGKKNNGIEAVVPKIAGHDKTAMWVFGKYLIYVTPHNRYDNRGNLMRDYLDFFRVDLDGKNHTLIYTTESTDLTTKNFTVWADATDNIYLLVAETDNGSEKPEPKIKKINVKTQKIVVLDTNVANVVLPTATQYGKQNESLAQVYGGVMSYVYYTKERKTINENSTLKGNLLYRCAINDGATEVIGDRGDAEKGITFTPLAVTPLDVDGAHASAQFVYKITPINGSATYNGTYLYAVTNQNMANYKHEQGELISIGDVTDVSIYANGFCTLDKKLYHYNFAGARVVLDQENGEAKKLVSSNVDAVLAVMGDTIYVQSGNTVYAVKKNGYNQTISIATTAVTDETTGENSTDTSDETEEHTLPVAVLSQPQGNAADTLIFVANAADIRLYHANGAYQYLRLKA